MSKKIISYISIAELFMAFIAYFAFAYHFETDPKIMRILANTDATATLLRLCIYIVPGINLINGMFGIIFSSKGLLFFVMLLEILAAYLTLSYTGKSDFMNVLGVIMIVLAILDIVCLIFHKPKKKEKTPKKKKSAD
ncbi:MAG: hypothetical protein IKS51_04850 [Erysipelotrichaceae bacterium]|nr:hypothetical protein [Erysipelotrichaceae bacterium]